MTSPSLQGSSASQSRPRAAFSRLSRGFTRLGMAVGCAVTLAGCASGGPPRPRRSSAMRWVVREISPPEPPRSPFASLALDAGDRRGLVVLGAQANAETYWPTGNVGLVTLRHEGLHVTAGLAADLLDTHLQWFGRSRSPWREGTPNAFDITRTWQDAEGLPRRMSARGSLHCGEAEPFELPLATLNLEPCEMTLRWENGKTTEGQLWREPQSRRLWAVRSRPGPMAPRSAGRWQDNGGNPRTRCPCAHAAAGPALSLCPTGQPSARAASFRRLARHPAARPSSVWPGATPLPWARRAPRGFKPSAGAWPPSWRL